MNYLTKLEKAKRRISILSCFGISWLCVQFHVTLVLYNQQPVRFKQLLRFNHYRNLRNVWQVVGWVSKNEVGAALRQRVHPRHAVTFDDLIQFQHKPRPKYQQRDSQ